MLYLNFISGKYDYLPASAVESYNKVIAFTATDNDGDIISSNQTLEIYKLMAKDDRVITNVIDANNNITISKPLLLDNDKYRDEVELNIDQTTESGGIISETDNEVIINYPSRVGVEDSFSYTLSDTSTANVDITIQSGNTLRGTDLSEYIIGGTGNDTIYGGSSNDVLTGVKGADVFVWSQNDIGNPDIDFITDFNPEEGDRIKLSEVINLSRLNTIKGRENFIGFDEDTSTLFISSSLRGQNGTKSIVPDRTDIVIQLNDYTGTYEDLILNYII